MNQGLVFLVLFTGILLFFLASSLSFLVPAFFFLRLALFSPEFLTSSDKEFPQLLARQPFFFLFSPFRSPATHETISRRIERRKKKIFSETAHRRQAPIALSRSNRPVSLLKSAGSGCLVDLTSVPRHLILAQLPLLKESAS